MLELDSRDELKNTVREIHFIEGDVPPNKSKKTNWALTLAQLEERPGKWALVKDTDHSGNAYAARETIRRHLMKAGKKDLYEVVVKTPEINKWAIYARFIGGETN